MRKVTKKLKRTIKIIRKRELRIMNKTKIEWCDMSWNPITGCLCNCEYCYAKVIARRFGGYDGNGSNGNNSTCIEIIAGKADIFHVHVLENALHKQDKSKAPYPFGFAPTFHKYRLNEPQAFKKPQTIFVGSMADVFGDWIPEDWIQAVFEACKAAPQHRYLFLTKNIHGYQDYEDSGGCLPKGDKFWYGQSDDGSGELTALKEYGINTFLSIEPILQSYQLNLNCLTSDMFGFGWVIIGAETGRRKNKVVPKRGWIEEIVDTCTANNIPIFMKNSLTGIWGELLIQEFPW